MKKVLQVSIFLVMLILLQNYTYAYPNGFTGRLTTTTGCTSCHANQNTNITLTHSGSTTVVAGASVSWTITVYRASATKSGCDIGVKNSGGSTVGTVSTSATGLKVSSGEITHSSTRTMSGGSYTYSFNWTAPTTAGTYYLRALATAGTGNQNDWNYMTPIAIDVVPPPSITLTKPTTAESWCLGSSQTITWNYANINNVKIELSTDGGTNYNTLVVESTPADLKTYTWSVPPSLVAGNQNRIRVSDASNPTVRSSSPVNFTILPVTEITSNPQSTAACEKQAVSFSVTAKGSNLSYQWRHNGNDITGSPNSNSYNIIDLNETHAGNYDVVVTGACGVAVTSLPAKLTINKEIKVLDQPDSQIVCKGTKFNLKFSLLGSGLKFQWKKNGVNLSGKTDSLLSFTSAVVADSGLYTCEVNSTCSGIIISEPAYIKVLTNPQIVGQPQAINATEGDSIVISINATGGNLSYNWKKNGVAITPQINSQYLVFKKVAAVDAGDYSCVVSNQCQTVNSASAKLTVNKSSEDAVLILSQNEAILDSIKVGEIATKAIKAIIGNSGKKDLTITSMSISGTDASAFTFTVNLPLLIAPGEYYDLPIKFQGNKQGLNTAKIIFTSNSSVNPELPIKGFVVNPQIKTENTLDFGNLTSNVKVDRMHQILNEGNADLDLELEIIGKDKDNFTLVDQYITSVVNVMNSIKISCISVVPGDFKAELLIKNKWMETKVVSLRAKLSTSDIEDFSTNELMITPNPASEFIMINQNNFNLKNNEIQSFEISNSLGERFIVNLVDIIDGNYRLNIADLPSGVYVLRMNNRFQKFIKW